MSIDQSQKLGEFDLRLKSLARRVPFDAVNLLDSIHELPRDLFDAGMLRAELDSFSKLMEFDLEYEESRLSMEIREKMTLEGNKTTEKIIREKVISEPSYQALFKLSLEAGLLLKECQSIVYGLNQKQSSIHEHLKLVERELMAS